MSRDLNEGATPTGYWGEHFPGRGKESKDPKKGAYLACLRTSKEANITKNLSRQRSSRTPNQRDDQGRLMQGYGEGFGFNCKQTEARK